VSNILLPNRIKRKKSNRKRKTIALVDDSPASLLASQFVLTESYNVLTACSGEDLLKMLEEHIPDLILLDIEMPGIDGLEVIKILKKQKATKSIPVIILAKSVDEKQEIEALSLGAIDYMSKPFSPIRLLKRIEMHLLLDAHKRELVIQRKALLHSNHSLHRMVVEKAVTVVELQEAIVSVFSELIECRDHTTGGHVERIQRFLYLLLTALLDHELYQEEVSKWNLALILQSALLHDVGKIGIRDHILLKPDKLTQEEFEIVKTHVDFGGDIIDKIMKKTSETLFLEHALVLITSHHEKWDGSGYPRGLKGYEIPLQGRAMAIVDVYDALTAERPYKKAYSHEQAVQMIAEGSGTHFDPDLVTVFMNIADQIHAIALESRYL